MTGRCRFTGNIDPGEHECRAMSLAYADRKATQEKNDSPINSLP